MRPKPRRGVLVRRLLLFCKEPSPGRVKTRLAASIGADAAADLAWALLADTCRLGRAAADLAGAALELHYDSQAPETRALQAPGRRFQALAAEHGCVLRAQGGGSLGERLAEGLSPDSHPRIALGTDAPDLAPSLVLAGFEGLTSNQAIAAPAPDGGYVLIGLGPGAPAAALASEGIRWSSTTTLTDTAAALSAQGVEWLPHLSAWRDVDDLADLSALADRLRGAPHSAPSCAAWIAERGREFLVSEPLE